MKALAIASSTVVALLIVTGASLAQPYRPASGISAFFSPPDKIVVDYSNPVGEFKWVGCTYWDVNGFQIDLPVQLIEVTTGGVERTSWQIESPKSHGIVCLWKVKVPSPGSPYGYRMDGPGPCAKF